MGTEDFKTPTFPKEIYGKLPEILKGCTDQFSDEREKDVVLTSALVVLSGCFSGVQGRYDKETLNTNLFGFIIAPPASGKGVMKYCRLLGQSIQKKHLDDNAKAREEYAVKLKEYEASLKKTKGKALKLPIKPKYPVLFIPGNTSSAAIYGLLDENDGVGIICETEADTLSGSIKQEWGGFSDMLRKAFHHETLSLARKTNSEYLEISHPRLSVLLSGTPDQVTKLISSAEDGLSSRFTYYFYKPKLEWKDPTPCEGCQDMNEYFAQKGNCVASIASVLNSSNYTFSITKEQFELLSTSFREKVELIKKFEGNGAMSAVNRLGLICFRIAMVLTACRIDIDNCSTQELLCSEEDFKTSLALAEVFFQHSMVVYALLPKQAKKNVSPMIRQFYSVLPDDAEFKAQLAKEKGEDLRISERSVGNYLKQLSDAGLLKCERYGIYRKVKI